ncbi:MAG: metallophosphoesterase [Alphaproteobacteria bacterium]
MAECLDLGEIDRPLLLCGGPYGNLEATVALLAAAAQRGFTADRIICTGDVVAYCADPIATVDEVRRSAMHVVMGNVEESLGAERDDCGCGFTEGSPCDVLAVEWYEYANRRIGPAARAWMRGLPRRIEFQMAGRRLAVIHGGVRQINRFIFASTPAAHKRGEIDTVGCDGIVAGHCGLPFTQEIDGALWHNAGVIGMPANDGTPRGWFSVLTPDAGRVRIEHVPLVYDHGTAAAKMRARGLPTTYAATLETGLWPAVDFLPPAEAATRGRRLSPVATAWPMAGAMPAADTATGHA